MSPIPPQPGEVITRTPGRGHLFPASFLVMLALAGWTMQAGSGIAVSSTSSRLAHSQRAHFVMGTVFTIETYHSDEAEAEAAIEAAFGEIRRTDELMSHYRPESEISLLNREAAQHPVPVQPELLELLQLARQIGRAHV